MKKNSKRNEYIDINGEIRVNIKRIAVCFLVMFSILVLYLLNFHFLYSRQVVLNAYNRRLNFAANRVVLGDVYDRNGVVLAAKANSDSSFPRYYPYDNLFSHAVGYNDTQMGRSGGEQYFIQHLLGLNNNFMSVLIQEYLDGKVYGNDVYMTLDYNLQEYSYQVLNTHLNNIGKDKAALIVMKSGTGEILTMISKPDFNPNNVSFNENENDKENQRFFNRVTQGKYPPGSIFKIITAAAGLTEIDSDESILKRTYNCQGFIQIGGDTLPCIKTHGELDIYRGMEVSCNVAFAEIGLESGKSRMIEVTNAFGFHKDFYADNFPVYRSLFPFAKQINDIELARNSIGQGKIILTPLHIAMITSSIVNKGVMMSPVLIREVRTHNDKRFSNMTTGVESISISEEIAEDIKQMMIGVVNNGTGRGAFIDGVEVGGKTGSAQNPQGEETHAWFVGFSKSNDGYIVIAVLIENAGTGGSVAAPIARQVLKKAIELGY